MFVDYRWKYLGYDFVPLARGVRLRIHADGRFGHLLRHGRFEASELLFLRRYLRPGDVFVDVGANIGLYALLAGSLVGETGRVLAFEPCLRTFQRLRRNVDESGLNWIECQCAALSDQTGSARLCVSRSGYDAWNSLAGRVAEGPVDFETVSTLSWDEFAAGRSQAGGVTMMKIDVEGWEVPVLNGAAALLTSPQAPLLQVEFTPNNAEIAGSSCSRLFDRILDFGYRLYQFDAERNEFQALSCAPALHHCNLYGIKDIAAVITRLRSAQEVPAT